jgi:hypothetical protein
MLVLVSSIVAFRGWPDGVVAGVKGLVVDDERSGLRLSGPAQLAADAVPAAAAVAGAPAPGTPGAAAVAGERAASRNDQPPTTSPGDGQTTPRSVGGAPVSAPTGTGTSTGGAGPSGTTGSGVGQVTQQLGETTQGTTKEVGDTVGQVNPQLGQSLTDTGQALGDLVTDVGSSLHLP